LARQPARLGDLISTWEPQLRRAFIEAVYNMRDAAQIGLIEEYLSKGDIDNALRAVNLDPQAWQPFDIAMRNAFAAGGEATAAVVPVIIVNGGFRSVFQFDVRNPAAERYLTQRSSTMIADIISDQQTMIRGVLTSGLSQGLNPRSVALDLVGRISKQTGRREGGMIGLTDSQAQWVTNYEAELRGDNPLAALERSLRDRRFDSAVRRAVKADKQLTEDQIDSMVRTYTNRALRYRAETIARTETLTALHEAAEQSLQQATQEGIDPNDITRIWRTAGDDRVRDSHAEMDGEERGMNEPFVSGDGNMIFYPGDPAAPPEETINCRCWLETNIDFLAGDLRSED